MRFYLSMIVICLLLAFIAADPPLSAGDSHRARVVDLTVQTNGRDLEANFRLENCFTPKMEEAIANGVPTTFRILVAVERPPVTLMKGEIVDFVLEHTIKYDRLNNEYRVHLPEHPQKVLVTSDFDQAKAWMSTVGNLPVIHTCWLRKNQEYTLKVKAELSKVELPLFLRYIIFWVSLWDFETDWQVVQFTI